MTDPFAEIIACRHAIRQHRDAKGDDRCWLDDYAVWALIAGSFPVPTEVPPVEEATDMCRAYFKLRRADTAEAQNPAAVTDPKLWDTDLEKMDDAQLTQELARIHASVRLHRDNACKPLTLDDDRALYAVLPEQVAADFRLPPEDEFLGEAKAPHAGCPSFWRSHAKCLVKRHNLHQWGPCHDERV
ncbi:MAG: hypothetical protein PSY14_11465 [bacterium]|nr:hypothetical protein [bacterium]